MTARSLTERLLSPAGFGLALLLFLLPFATVSCSDTNDLTPFSVDYTFTGLDLVTGGAPEINGVLPDDDGRPMAVAGVTDEAGFAQQFGQPVQPLAVVAVVALLIGMIASFGLRVDLRERVGAAAALGALVLLLVEVLAILPARAASELARALPGSGLVTHTTPAVGFYLTVVVLVLLIGRGIVLARRPVAAAASPATAPPPTAPPPAEPPPAAGNAGPLGGG